MKAEGPSILHRAWGAPGMAGSPVAIGVRSRHLFLPSMAVPAQSDPATRVLFVTAPENEAPRIARVLVEERLVACANILPGARSFYWWNGGICDDSEAVLWMETAAGRLAAVVARLRQLHPYSVPKIVVFAPTFVNEDYEAWLCEETSS